LYRSATWFCWSDRPEASPALQSAARQLSSPEPKRRRNAEAQLCNEWRQAAPLLRRIAQSRRPDPQTVAAALLLHRQREPEGAELLRRMAGEHRDWTGTGRAALKLAVREAVGTAGYIRQAAGALVRLEQMHQSFSVLTQFRQATEALMFLGAPLPLDLLHRAMVVRAVGGEDLRLVRQVVQDTQGVHVEHVCMARKEAVEMSLSLDDRKQALHALLTALAHPSVCVQLTALYGVEALDDPGAINPLYALAQQASHPLCEDAARIVARLRGRANAERWTLLRPVGTAERMPEALLRPAAPAPADPPEALLRPLPRHCDD
jgi:hypothetical protein